MSDDMKALVETALKAKILEAFQSNEKFVENLIVAVLDERVDNYGKKIEKGSWEYNKATPVLDQIVGSQIRTLVQKCVQEIMSEREESLKQVIRQKLTSDMLIDAIVQKMVSVAGEEWRITVNLGKDK